MDLWVREARLFKYGSGTGTNFSNLRGENERLSGGGKSSGLMSFLKIGDRAAGAIKSGGTTRRAAKMVVVDADHPDVENYIDWKVKEEEKVAALVTGSKLTRRHLKAMHARLRQLRGLGDDCFDPEKNPALKREIKAARRSPCSDNMIKRVIQLAKQGHTTVEFDEFDGGLGFRGLPHRRGPELQQLGARHGRLPARRRGGRALGPDAPHGRQGREDDPGARPVGQDRLRRLGLGRPRAAVPHDHQRLAHLPGVGPIRASNPCSEYHVPRRHGLQPRVAEPAAVPGDGPAASTSQSYEHAVRLWTVVLETSVLMAQFPSDEIAQLSYDYRTLGLGYANLGGFLMSSGIPYDSDEGRALCGALSALMTGVCYATSAEIASELGPFPGYAPNAEHMLRVMRNHRRAAYGEASGYEALSVAPVPLDRAACPRPGLVDAARRAWDLAIELGERHGYRNAQVSVVAPTGTIGLVMDCDTTGIEPDFALVKFKKLAGGGYFKVVNRAVPEALRALGYREPTSPRSRSTRSATATCARPRASRRRPCAPGASPTRSSPGSTRRWQRLRHQVRLQQMDARRRLPRRDLKVPAEAGRARLRAAALPRLHQGRDRGRQHPRLRGDDAGGRAAPQARALRGVRLRQPVRPHRQALPLGREPHPHDGGVAALHLGRDLQDHQHAERRDGRGLQGRLHAVLAARR